MPDDNKTIARSLIEDAMRDVSVVLCATCHGLGELRYSRPALRCPVCVGSGETVRTDLETPRDCQG